jgi:hypothetical protein
LRSGLAALVAAAALAGCAAGCSVGGSSGWAHRSEHTCADANKTITKLKAPGDPKAALAYALDRYVAVEHAVSELTDSTLPGGAVGRDLRTLWLAPARASLKAADVDLRRLRTAVRAGDRTGASVAFGAATTAGTSGVDTAVLRTQGLSACATLFTPAPHSL